MPTPEICATSTKLATQKINTSTFLRVALSCDSGCRWTSALRTSLSPAFSSIVGVSGMIVVVGLATDGTGELDMVQREVLWEVVNFRS